MPDTAPCPLCFRRIPSNPRYPRAVCPDCIHLACDGQGHPLDFFNADASGGFIAIYRHSGARYSGHICFIRGVRCRADEGRFGGIVVQVLEGQENR